MRAQIHKHYYLYAFLLGIGMSLSLFVLIKPSASAATINVVAGTDAINDNDQCQLSEAIENINDQAQTNNDCPAGNGNNDTIQLPVGTITLSANSYLGHPINDVYSGQLGGVDRAVGPDKSYKIIGVSKEQSIVSGGGQYFLTGSGEGNSILFKNFSIINANMSALVTLDVASLEIDSVKIDAQDSCLNLAILTAHSKAMNNAVIITNSLISNITCTGPNMSALAINIGNVLGGTTTAQIENVTVSNIDSEVSSVGIYISDGADATISNTTVKDISAELGVSAIVGQFLNNSEDDIVSNISMINVTIGKLQSPVSAWQPPGLPLSLKSGGLAFIGGAIAQGSVQINVSLKNVISYEAVFGGEKAACQLLNLNDVNDIPGNTTINSTSLGGNISDDNSCNDYFTQETDKNNITNLADYLGDIANNGGSVPTMALLPGNPAIDGGVCGEGVPETDARGIARPQGKTCDSGAYEIEQATPTGTISGDKAVALNVATGVVVNEFGTVSGSIPSDNQGDADYEFPLGLLSFELGVPQSSTNEISLDFESDLDPASVVARKYNPSDQTFTTLTNAVITKITKDNKPTLRLTYSIKDGEFPDLDNQANGIITDPIGLATEKKGVLANTGDLVILAIPVGTSLLLAVFLVTYLDYRKHKKPLMDADPFNASTYTYWHHLRTVTIPLFSYRLSVGFERKQSTRAITN